MLSWLAKQVLARNMRTVSAGDPAPLLRMDAKDIRFRFPGKSSWGTELEGKEELAKWLGRFTDAGVQIGPHEVVLKGFPWKQAICVRGLSFLDSPDGERVYANRYVIWGRLSWGLLREYEVYEDTEKTSALDGFLAGAGKL